MPLADVQHPILSSADVTHVNIIHFFDADKHQHFQWCASQELLQSAIIRKLGRLEGRSILVCECSTDLIDILLRANMPIHSPTDALAVLAAYDYLLVKPSIILLAEMLKKLMTPLVRRAIVFPPKALLCELCKERNILDLAAHDAGQNVPQIANLLLNGGYRGADFERIRTTISITNDARGHPCIRTAVSMAANCQYSLSPVLTTAKEHFVIWQEYLEYCEATATILLGIPQEDCMTEHTSNVDNADGDDIQIWPKHSDVSIPYWSLQRDRSYLQNTLADAVMLIPDFLYGPEFVLLHTERLAKTIDAEILHWLHWRSCRVLYAREGSATRIEEVPDMSLDMVRSMQSSFQNNRIPLADFLPFDRTTACDIHLLPWSSPKPREVYIPESMDKLHARVHTAVPWLRKVWEQCPSTFLTGSLLMQSLAPMPHVQACPAGDVDLFVCERDELPRVTEIVCTAMQAYQEWLVQRQNELGEDTDEDTGDDGALRTMNFVPNIQATQISSTKFSIDASTASMPASMKLRFRCDIYVNSLAAVVRYHLPCVRCAFSPLQLFISPSCAIALATRVCIDYHYFASRQKTPYDIITRKWLSGYNLVVNAREQRQLIAYMQEIVPSNKKAVLRNIVEYDLQRLDSLHLYTFESLNQRYLSLRDSSLVK